MGFTRPLPHLMGRCGVKGCKTVVRVTGEWERRQVRGYRGQLFDQDVLVFKFPARRAKRNPSMPREFLPPETHGWDTYTEVETVEQAVKYRHLPHCVAHQRPLRWEQLKGAHVETVRCDARCEGAKRADCECSCGGENHGRAHAA